MSNQPTILLVDDDEVVRRVMANMLRRDGYSLLEAASGEEALAAARAHAGHIDLMVTDVVMLPMDGLRLAAEMTARQPSLKVLLISGHTDHARVRAAISRAGRDFLFKPFTRAQLSEKIQMLLQTAADEPHRMPALTCPACGGSTAVEIIGVLVGTVDSDWRACSACGHLWSTSEDPDVFPLMVGNPNAAASPTTDRPPAAGVSRAIRFRVRLPTRYRLTDEQQTWYRGLTENISRSGMLLRTADRGELDRLVATRPSVVLEIEVPHHGAVASRRLIRCEGDVVRRVESDLTDPLPGVAVAIRGYQLSN